jgi:hypothetical protein
MPKLYRSNSETLRRLSILMNFIGNKPRKDIEDDGYDFLKNFICDSISVKSKEKIKKAQVKVNEAMTKEKESALRTQEVLESYINNKAKTLGFNPTKILESVKSRRLNQTEVDKLINEEVDRLDRYRKLPTTNDSLLNALSESSTVKISSMKPNEEDLQTKTFMEQVYNMKG